METLKNLLYKFMGEYAHELELAKKEGNYKRPFGNLVRKDIAGKIRQGISDGNYKVKGSVGAGLWTDVPWIAVFDKRITTSAQKGVYIVYLLNKDTKTLYLTLNQGATDVAHDGGVASEGKLPFVGIASSKSAKTTVALETHAKIIRDKLPPCKTALSGEIQCGSATYNAGCIFYKEYHIDSIPDDAVLFEDLKQFIDLYKDYYNIFVESTIKEHGTEGEESGVAEIDIKDTLSEIKGYIFARGFDYPDGLIENFYLSLKSKPFVILAGTSGTGKTRFVKLFAESIGAEFKLISVRPDWSDGSDLFGHADLNGNFIPGPVCSAFETAINEPERPVFLCLDEMNLARVEYYLSDFLSVIETREKEDGHIVTVGIAQYEKGIPDNLYIIGTVNMDETTFPFSKKVLDRANTIEFSYVDLMPKPRTEETFDPQELLNSFLCTEYLVLATDCSDGKDLVEKICTELQDLNGKLLKADAHVGYRVRDEIVFYMLNNEKAGHLLTYEQAMDNEIMQKILPRIQGSSMGIKTLLIDLFKFCMGSGSGIDADAGNVGEQMRKAASSAKYPESAKKIGYMMTRFEDDGFTSYWL